ncbi:hypothetical protein C8Q78DRAFT_1015787 [Trametes maxima]|nr:hypothetical protein C8Q78DRAFT_1015787 [Trametes maxima]
MIRCTTSTTVGIELVLSDDVAPRSHRWYTGGKEIQEWVELNKCLCFSCGAWRWGCPSSLLCQLASARSVTQKHLVGARVSTRGIPS